MRNALLVAALVILSALAQPVARVSSSTREAYKTYLPLVSASTQGANNVGSWSIVVPEATTNLVANPSIESATTGYTAVGSTLAVSATQARRGVSSLRVTPTSSTTDGVYYAVTLVAATAYAFSVDVFGVAGVPYRIYIYDVTGTAILGTPTTFTGDGKWHRYTQLATTAGNTSHRLYIVKNTHASTGAFYVDGVQLEAKAYATTYVDGDQDGCAWAGAAHASASARSAQYRLGGRDYDFTSAGVTVTMFSGTGMPPLSQLTQEQALLPGSIYRGMKISERVMTLVFLAPGSSLTNLHLLRKQLIDLIKPDLTATSQPFLLRYTGAGVTMEIPVVYDSGLEQGNWLGYSETIAMRVIAYDEPLWREDGERGIVITTGGTLTTNYIAGRIDGAWSGMASGMDGVVRVIVQGPGNILYAGGGFHLAGGVANTVHIAKWDGAAWTALGTGTSGDVFALAVAPDGTLYAGGAFGSAGGVANTSAIAKWNGSVWSALGTGMNNEVHSLAIGTDGALYAGGSFTTAGGVAAAHIAKWDGSTWTALGAGTNGDVYAIAIAPDGTLYAGGAFGSAGGVANTSAIAKWNGSVWSALGTGMNNEVNILTLAPDGTLYAGGDFSLAGGVANTENIAKWNGSAWSGLSTGVSGSIFSLAFASNGTLYVSGNFIAAGGLTFADRLAQWNGTTWSALDIDLPATPDAHSILPVGTNLYLGFSTAGTATVSALQTLTLAANNPSTATTYPIITIKRTGGTSATLTHVRNEITGKQLYFNYPIADGETVTIDLRPRYKTVKSSAFGNMIGKLLTNSDFGSFALNPGAGQISIYVPSAGSPTITASIRWKVQHWAVDGGAQ